MISKQANKALLSEVGAAVHMSTQEPSLCHCCGTMNIPEGEPQSDYVTDVPNSLHRILSWWTIKTPKVSANNRTNTLRISDANGEDLLIEWDDK